MVTTVFGRAAGLALTIMTVGCLLTGCKGGDDASSTKESNMGAAVADAPMASGTVAASPSTEGPHMALRAANMRGSGDAKTASLPIKPVVALEARQVIRHADLDIRVTTVEKSEKEVANIVTAVGGYTEKATSSDLASAHPVLTLALRVPVGSFDATIAKFEMLGTRLSKTISSDDVTGQLVDLDARLKILRAQEDVYRDMLRNRTTLQDVFSIQSQLQDVRTQIETISGERKSQAGLAALSTINLTLEQNAVVTAVPTDPNWFAMTLSEATSGAGMGFRLFTTVIVWIVAFCPFWIPVLLVLRKLRKSPRTQIPF